MYDSADFMEKGEVKKSRGCLAIFCKYFIRFLNYIIYALYYMFSVHCLFT